MTKTHNKNRYTRQFLLLQITTFLLVHIIATKDEIMPDSRPPITSKENNPAISIKEKLPKPNGTNPYQRQPFSNSPSYIPYDPPCRPNWKEVSLQNPDPPFNQYPKCFRHVPHCTAYHLKFGDCFECQRGYETTLNQDMLKKWNKSVNVCRINFEYACGWFFFV